MAKKLVAVKMLKDDATEESRHGFQGEIDLHTRMRFNHPNVISLIGVCTTEDPMMIVMEYMHYGDLRNFLVKREAVR